MTDLERKFPDDIPEREPTKVIVESPLVTAKKERDWRNIFPEGGYLGVDPKPGVIPKDDTTHPDLSVFDEPDIYEEAHVEGQHSEQFTVVVDPVKTEVIGEIDLPVEEE